MRTELVWIYESFVAECYLKQSIHSSLQSAFLIREGHLTIQTNKGQIMAGPGQWVFPKQGDRIQQFSAGARILSVCYHWKWPGNQPLFDWDIALVLEAAQAPELEQEALRIKGLADDSLSGSGPKLKNDTSDLADYFRLHRAFHDWLAACALVFQRNGQCTQPLGCVDPRLLHGIHLLEQHALNASFHGDPIAYRIGLSPRQMDRLFIEQFGLSPQKYFERRRFEAALDRVRFSSEPIKQIAYTMGFNALSRFSTWFRRNAKATPREVRKSAQG